MSSRFVVALLSAALVLFPAIADAQWFVAGYLGTNRTSDAPISIDQPSRDTSLTFSNATFEARPFKSPQYYGVRGGRLFGENRRYGVEFEWIHPKAYADATRVVQITGRYNGVNINTTARMDTIVQRYAMSHGMNFVFINAVLRLPLDEGGDGFASRVAFIARGGAGPMVPHGETTVDGASREQYETGGIGYQLAAGVDVRVSGVLSALIEYKFARGRPEITIVDGTGRTTANVHQLGFGLALGLSR